MDDFESRQGSGLISSVFRSALYAVNRSPFLSAMMAQDQRVFGRYLHTPGNLFKSAVLGSMWTEMLARLSQVGAIREGVHPNVFAYLMNALSVGIISIQADGKFGVPPPFEDLMNAVAVMIDRALLPPDGGNQEAGREVIHQMAMDVETQLVQSAPEEE